MMKAFKGTRIYLVFSQDDYDIDHFLFLLRKSQGHDKEDIVQEVYHRDETDLSIILDSASNLPMFAPKKLIIMKYSSVIPAEDIPYLQQYLNHPSPQTIFVITAKEWDKKADRKGGFRKFFRKVLFSENMTTPSQALWISFPTKTQKEKEAPHWIQLSFEERGLQIDKEALSLFYEICGKDKLTMTHEIEKLASFKEGNKRVTIKDIKGIAAENNVFDVYSLLHYICQRERGKAIKALRVLLESRKNHPFIIWHLDNFLSKLAVAKQALNAGESAEAAAARAEIRYYKDQFIHNARIVRDDLIMEAPARILRADRLMKSGLPEEIILEKLIYELT